MSQTSIASYFATRKRAAADDIGVIKAKKVLILDRAETTTNNHQKEKEKDVCEEIKTTSTCEYIYSSKEVTLNNNNNNEILKNTSTAEQIRNKVVTKLNFDPVTTANTTNTNMTIKRGGTPKSKSKKPIKEISNQPSIQTVFQNLQSTKNIKNSQESNEKTPPTTPVKNALDNIDSTKHKDVSLNEIKNKLTRSSRLAELKASIAKFSKSADKLKEIEKKTSTLSKKSTGPTLKTFEKIEVEVQLSPKKIVSPVKQYLSPKKDISSPKKNLFGLLSPSKSGGTVPAYQRFQSLAAPEKPSLTLPFKYRGLAEMFRSIDTVCAMMYNRKELITFSKVKPAVQSMMRRNLTLEHFAQIHTLYPAAFAYKWEKMKTYSSVKETQELVIIPQINEKNEKNDDDAAAAAMNPTCLLERRRKLFSSLIEKVKEYHNEFLQSLDPPMDIPGDKITRWHPEFDIEKVPDIEQTELPKQPDEEKMTTGQEVLEKARSLFSCNTRMEKALERLKQLQEAKPNSSVEEKNKVVAAEAPSLKGIPTALLEKIRAKQAAKALDTMTRSSLQDKEAEKYIRLPEIARLMRNTFVAEKKGVLPLEECIVKLNNSYRSRLTNTEIEEHLRLLSTVVPGWLVFHEIRRTLFVKLARDGDMGKVMTRLEQLVKEKSGS